MKRKMMSVFMIGVAFLTINTSCSAIKNANKTQKGAGIGVAGGALIGGLIGGNVKGALIGAAIGGAAGGVIGNTMDKQAKKIEEMVAKATYVKRANEWKIYWQRADMKWHLYEPFPTARTLQEFLDVLEEDHHRCFWG